MEKFRKLGKEPTEPMAMSKNHKYYPSFRLELENIPEAKSWKIGNKYYLALELKQVAMEQHGEGDKGSVSFEIHGLKILKHQGEKASSRDADE